MKKRILNNKFLAPLSVFVLSTILLFILFVLMGRGMFAIIFSLFWGAVSMNIYMTRKRFSQKKEEIDIWYSKKQIIIAWVLQLGIPVGCIIYFFANFTCPSC